MQYDVLEPDVPLGEGSYGKVYKARDVKSGKLVAMKKMRFDVEEEGVPTTVIREIALLKELSHPHVVKLLDVFCSTTRLVLIFELIESDLKKYMKSLKGRLLPRIVKNLSFQLFRGIEFCHASRILHRDIKPQNLLLDPQQLTLKIADFGLARLYTTDGKKYTHEVVTIWYRAPELLLGSSVYTTPVDIWSVLCVVGEMATGAPLFAGDSEIDTIFAIFQKRGTPTYEEWPGLEKLPYFKLTFPKWQAKAWADIRNIEAQVGSYGMDILEKGLVYDPPRRISARRALQHEYFEDVDRSGIF